MNNDIRISCSFPEHYKTKKLIAIAGSSAPFSLVCLWIYAARNKPDGFLDNMDNFDIEIASNWNGEPGKFFEAIIKCRFLIEADEGFFIKDWQEHQPYASGAEERSAKARFSILARHNKDLHTKLKAQGVDSLTVEEYKSYTKRIPTVKQSNTESYDFLTPSPSPSPSPSPKPSKKKNNTLPEKKSQVQPKINPWAIWVDVNREYDRADPAAIPKDTAAGKNLLKAIGCPDKLADVMRCYLEDLDTFLLNNGHGLSFLQARVNKYLNKQPENSELSMEEIEYLERICGPGSDK